MKFLRIVFTIISAVFAALVFLLGALLSWSWAILCMLGAFLFFGLMMLCKQKQEENEKRARRDDLSDLDFGGEKNDSDDKKMQQ